MNKITPDYLNTDFNTLIQKIKDSLQNTEEFKDYNFAGSNISLLIELCSYIGELNTYYINQLSKNILPGSVEIYEPASKQAQLGGYSPLGPLSSVTQATINLEAEGLNGNQLIVSKWAQIWNDDNVPFLSLDTHSFELSGDGPYSLDLELLQGEFEELEYTGEDLVDDRLTLPFNTYANNRDRAVVAVYVNDEEWIRVFDNYELLSQIEETDNVFLYQFNEYRNHVIQFSQSRRVPGKKDSIRVQLVRTLASDGNVAQNSFSDSPEEFLYNNTQSQYIEPQSFSIQNLASRGGRGSESIDEITKSYTLNLHSQFRNVTKQDYIGHLNSHPLIQNSTVWGEADIAQNGGDTRYYNKVFIQTIPRDWGTSTIETSGYIWEEAGLVDEIQLPYQINDGFSNEILQFLSQRKMISAYEEIELPELVYFGFKFGLRVLPTYNQTLVIEDIKQKLSMFFHPRRRSFGEEINFFDIENYVKDTSIVEDSPLDNIRGIRNFFIRDIYAHTGIADAGTWEFPQYTEEKLELENRLTGIKLQYNQFPVLSLGHCSFRLEG